ncbi:MAG: hypothetical protein FJZ47_10030 [Candidatus Tectomicrobia bacterium]|uniref:Uncharacterized protein n=1 Tax=Tectimicrobiota bacterium TaxID=2528274 RepID=A0A938B3U2_UNCTE|nr:hypothetical protein [Candidatus Tectomicrobia bacterium]
MLATWQNVLIRLVLDRSFRQQFSADPTQTLAPFALTPAGQQALLAIPYQDVERFAVSLMQKRWEQVQQVIPLSRRVCPSLQSRYCTWLGTHPAQVSHTVLDPGTAEAWRALPFLYAAVQADTAEAPYAADLLAFEVLRACARQDGQPRVLRSTFALHLLAQEIARGLLPTEPEHLPSVYRFDQRGIQWKAQTDPLPPG